MNVKTEKELIHYITENKENLYRLAYSYVRNEENALDIVSESIYKALSSSRNLQSASSLKAWFYRIVVNTSLDYLRKQKRIQLVDDQSLELLSEGGEDPYQDIDLEKAMAELPEMYRIVVVLRYFEDMKLDEIGEVLSENISTVKTRLYEALRRLRIKLSAEHLKEAP